MSWTTPVTDRTDGTSVMTYQDMDRITGNLKWLYDGCVNSGIPIAGTAISQTSWARDDIITTTFWTELLTCLENVCTALNYTPPIVANSNMIWNNINVVEDIELVCYNMLAAFVYLSRLNHYVGDKLGTSYLYAGDSFNAGGKYS